MRKPPLSVPSLTDFAHQAIGRAVCAAHEKGGGGVPVFPLLVDATAGNGYDTALLARLAGEGGRVVAFDVQRAALDAVRTRLEGEGLLSRADLVLGGHEHMEEALRGLFPGAVLTEGVSAVSFNLGFLPGSDKRIVTQAETTLEALDAAARLLSPGGLLSVHVYTGHAGGMEEGRVVLAWSEALPWEKWRVTALSQHNKARNREWLVLAERLYLPQSDRCGPASASASRGMSTTCGPAAHGAT